MTASPLIVRGLRRRFEDRLAVDRVDLEVAAGEIVGLVGPNGAGKTTTLRCIAGVLPADEGEVRIAGHDIAKDELEAKRHLAYVQDEPAPFEVLTVAEHLEFTARLYGLGDDWRARGDALLERFELADRRDALGAELSRGMRQKLSFCQAWLPLPEVILLDEPLSGLDPRGIRAARAAIAAERERGAAVVLSSHLLELVQSVADRIVIVDAGRVLFAGTLAEARAAVADDPGSSLEEIYFAATEGPRGAAGGAAPDARAPVAHGAVPTDGEPAGEGDDRDLPGA